MVLNQEIPWFVGFWGPSWIRIIDINKKQYDQNKRGSLEKGQ